MRIAVFTKNLTNPAYGAARLGAERAAAQFGAQVLHFVPRKGDDREEQSALIDQALALEPPVDAFVLSPVHATQVDPAIRRIAAAGMPMVGFVNPINAAPSVAYVSSDDYQLAMGIAQYLFRHLHGRGRVLIVTGPQESFTSLERLRGFREAAREHPGITVAGVIAGDYVRETARDRAAQWLGDNARARCLPGRQRHHGGGRARCARRRRPHGRGGRRQRDSASDRGHRRRPHAGHGRLQRHADGLSRHRVRGAAPARRAGAAGDRAAGADRATARTAISGTFPTKSVLSGHWIN